MSFINAHKLLLVVSIGLLAVSAAVFGWLSPVAQNKEARRAASAGRESEGESRERSAWMYEQRAYPQ